MYVYMYIYIYILSGSDSDKLIRQTKICMTQTKLGSDYVARPGLLKSKHKISFAADVHWQYFSFVFVSAITRELATTI